MQQYPPLTNKILGQLRQIFSYRLVWIAGCTLAWFIFSYLLIWRNNSFVGGDISLVGLMLQDAAEGKFFSWYYYGQIYFGNLEVWLLLLPTKITGVSPNSIYFWQHLLTALAVGVGLWSFRAKPLISLWAPGLIFVGIPVLRMFWYYVGFPLVLLITVLAFALFKDIWRAQKIRPREYVFLGFLGGLALWHNPSYLFVLPLAAMLGLWFERNMLWPKIQSGWWKNLGQAGMWGGIGLILGLIPFALATWHIQGQNLLWFGGQNNNNSNWLLTLRYYLRDLLLLSLNRNFLDTNSIRSIGITSLNTLENTFRMSLILASGLAGLIAMRKWSKYTINWAFLGFIGLLLILRGIGGDPTPLLWVRYLAPWLMILMLTVWEICQDELEFIPDTLPNPKMYLQKVASSLALFLIMGFGLVSFSYAVNSYQEPYYRGRQYYENLAEFLRQQQVSAVYCNNYFDLCATLAMLLYREVEVQLVRPEGFEFGRYYVNQTENPGMRNPRGYFAADQALANGQKVYSVVTQDYVPEGVEPIASFSATPTAPTYYVFPGKFKQP